jgi:predicted RNA methylase
MDADQLQPELDKDAPRRSMQRLVLALGVEVWLGDCMDIAPTLQGVDAVISDPPYGMAWPCENARFKGGSEASQKRRPKNPRIYAKGIIDDDKPFDPSPWLAWEKVVLFGSNHFGARLPVGTKLIWIKRMDAAFGSFLSDAEEAWMKGGHGIYCKRDLSMAGETMTRVHPTQKPVALMAWCMDKAKVPEGATVLDPYMGSGSTIIAAIRTGRKAIGIEKDPEHFKNAVERIKRELAQGDLFRGQNAKSAGTAAHEGKTI